MQTRPGTNPNSRHKHNSIKALPMTTLQTLFYFFAMIAWGAVWYSIGLYGFKWPWPKKAAQQDDDDTIEIEKHIKPPPYLSYSEPAGAISFHVPNPVEVRGTFVTEKGTADEALAFAFLVGQVGEVVAQLVRHCIVIEERDEDGGRAWFCGFTVYTFASRIGEPEKEAPAQA